MKKLFGGVKETLANRKMAKKANKASKDNIDTLTIDKAKKLYAEKNGREMTPSFLKSELDSMFPSKSTREYLKNKKKIKKDYYDKYGF